MFERLRTVAARALMPKSVYNAYNAAFLNMIGGSITKYDNNAESYIENGYNINSDVYSVITQIANKCSSIPYNIKKVKDQKSLQSLKNVKGSKGFHNYVKQIILKAQAFEETELDMPLERPNVYQTWEEFIALSAVFMKLTGNCFWYFVKPELRENADPIAIYILPAHQTYLVLKKNPEFLGIDSPIDYYKLIEGNQYVKFPAENVIHIKNPNPNFDMNGSHLYGQSDLRAALKNIQSSNEALDNNIKTMKNAGGFGFIHSKGQNVMTADQAESIKDRLKEMDADPSRLSSLAGSSAELGFTRIALTTDELKPFDYLDYDQKAICNVLGWSSKLLNNTSGSSSLTDGALNQERKRAISDTILPLLNKFSEALNSKFLPLFDSTQNAVIEFDHTELPEMQEDMEKLSKWANEGVDKGTLNRDEWRLIMRFPKVGTPEMQAYTVNMNIISLEDALVPLENTLNINDDD